jgi:hypothetical protein
MLKSKPSTFNPLSAITVGLKKASAELCQSSAQKQIAPIGLVAILGLTGVSWLTTSFVAPQSAQAYTARVNLALNRESGESFRSFLRRAESVARAAAQRSFDRDILVTDVAVTVVGQNDGAIAPILSLEVSRQAWRRSPDPQRWITYFPNTQSLLGFKDTPEQPGTQPAGVPQPSSTPQPAASPSPQAPSGPRVIELPGGNRRVIPGTPTQQAPAQQAPAQQGSPNNQNTNQNNQIPNIPGAPIQRVPLPAPPTR